VPAAGARQVAVSAPALAAAAAPAGRGGFRHSPPLGSYGSRMPGGTDGRAGTAGRVPGGPGVAGTAGSDPTPAAAADGAPTGPVGAVAGDGCISAKGDVVLRGPVRTGTTAGAPEAPGDEATGGGRRQRRRWLSAGRRRGSGDDGPAPLLGPSHRGSVPDPPHRDPRAPRGAGLACPRGRARRRLTGRHAAGAARCAWDCYSPSSVMIASGDLTFMEGIICIGW